MLIWIKNTLIIKAPIATQQQILNSIASETSYLDFNKIKPVPEALQIEFCPLGELGLAVLERNTSFLHSYLMSQGPELGISTISQLIQHVNTNMPQAIELGEKYKDNLKQYQASTWYDWCRREWGVKWNASQVKINANSEVLSIEFETPWADPEPVLRALSSKFPNVLLECHSIQTDDALNAITRVYSAGQCLDCGG